MHERTAFAYAHTRLQAHQGRRPTKSTWHFLNASKSLGHYLESARQTSLAPWVTHMTTASDTHSIEHGLRRDWRAYVNRVASWLPVEWRAAALFVGELADLPLDEEPQSLTQWRERFRQLWPQGRRTDGLDALIALLAQHLSPANAAYKSNGVEARYTLIARLERIFRRSAQHPVAAFAFLAMVALDIEHLRAHLVHRCVFPETFDRK